MKKIIEAVIIAVAMFALSTMFLSNQHSIVLAIIAALVTLWSNEALPLGVVSLLPLILFPIFEVLTFNDVASNYAKSIMFLFIGGFLLALGVQKSGLHKVIASKLLSFFPSTPRGIMYALATTSALMSAFLSNVTVTLLLAPIAVFLTDIKELKVRLLLATAYGASIGGILTPIGTPPNVIFLGLMEDMGQTTPNFVEWMVMTAPIMVVMLLVVPYILSFKQNHHKIEFNDKQEKLTREQKIVTGILLTLIFLLVINTPLKTILPEFALNEKMLILGFGLLLFLPSFKLLEWEDTKNFPYDILFLFGAGFSIAMAFSHSGLATEITHKLSFLANQKEIVVIFAIALFVTFSTEITSNTALTSIAIPIIYEFATLHQLDTSVILMTATIAASYAFMLPIATPPNAIAMSYKVVTIKDMAKVGFLINILAVIILTLFANFYWSLF